MDFEGRDHRARATRRLASIVAGAGPFDLVEAALCVAAHEYASLDVDRDLAHIRRMAAEGARRAGDTENPFARLDALRGFMFEELGFRGNQEDFDDPRNSYLNDVVNRRLGIPLTLSILFLEIVRAAGFSARGVALPGHFVCRTDYDGRTIMIDPYNGGHVITEEDCRSLVARSTGRASLFRGDLLQGADERTMLVRMLLNLKHVHLSGGDYARALGAVERILLLRRNDANEIRDRGFLKAHLGRPGAAIEDLETYLELAPVAPDAESVKGRLVWLRRRLTGAES